MSTLETTALSRTLSPTALSGYRLEGLLGRGGMGEVHRAVQLSLGRPVAVKLLARELAADATFVSRFRKEAAALAALSHPNIVSVVDQGEAGGVPFLVMEFVDGPSLREVMRAPLFDAQSALRLFAEVARAIAYAHGRGIIHRDLKPENILLDEQAGGVPKVTDFGLAGFLQEGSRFALTQTHMAMGTAAYMAPEQRLDAKNVDGRADVYALGVVLYEMLTGEVPVGTFSPPSERKAGVDARLDAVVARCLKPIAEERFPSVAALLQELEPLLPEGRHTVPLRLTAGQRVKEALTRAGRVAWRITATALVLGATGVLAVTALREREARRPTPAEDALGGPLGTPVAIGARGRLDEGARGRQVTLGTGPDLVPVLSSGRAALQDGEALVFGPATGEARVGRAVLDTVETDSEALEWVALAQAATPPADLLGRARQQLLGPPPPARAGLLLMGDPGRFVSVVVSEEEGGEARLEWALGERRGVQLAPTGLSVRQPLRVELTVTPTGELRAWLGADRNRRPLGEPLQLGEGWRRLFGRLPQPAVGCLEGECRFTALRYAVRRPPAPAVTPAVAVGTSAPAPAVSRAVPRAVPPPPVKRPQPRKRR